MDEETIKGFRRWTNSFMNGFSSVDPVVEQGYQLKRIHTRHVAGNCVCLAEELGLAVLDVCVAETIGWFHDLGRFVQLDRIESFDDKRLDHADLSVQVIKDNELLDDVEKKVRDVILVSIQYHNRYVSPNFDDKRTLFFSQLLRDADKLDIFRVYISYFMHPQKGYNPLLGLHLTDSKVVNEDIVSCFERCESVNRSLVKSVLDVKLFILSWIFDITFDVTLQLIKDRGYIKNLISLLPDTNEKKQVIRSIDDYVAQRLK